MFKSLLSKSPLSKLALLLTASILMGQSGGAFAATEAVNGVAVNALTAQAQQSVFFEVKVPVNATGLNVALQGGTGDADLYLRYGSNPTDILYDFASEQQSNNETIDVASPTVGSYFVQVYGYETFAGATLTASYTLTSSASQTGQVEVTKSSKFRLESSGGTVNLNLGWTQNSDLDLYLYDAAGTVVAKAETENKPETLSFDTGNGGIYTVEVYNYSGDTSTFTLDMTLAGADKKLHISSFNIQFLGNYKARDNAALADLVKDYDIVVIQELVAPPYAMNFPDGTPVKPDPEAAVFFDAMTAKGFSYWLSEEDTGSGDKLHQNSSATEWWVVFYKPAAVTPAMDLPKGFLATDHANNDHFERVPYAFPFRTGDGKTDFVLISVHLQPGTGPANRARREEELATIASWIDANDQKEKDFIILGDNNIYNTTELANATPAGFLSLNEACVATNTNLNSPQPYDHVFYNTTHTSEIDTSFGFEVVDLLEKMETYWTGPNYPGNPYDHNTFRTTYSDHHPVTFKLNATVDDD